MWMTTASSEGESASRARLRYERFPARHERRVGAAKERAVRAEGERVGGNRPSRSGFPKRARGWRIGARGDFETSHGSANGRRAIEMDRAPYASVFRAHVADHAGNRTGVGPAQRFAPDPAGRWSACGDRTGSQADTGHAQRKECRRSWSLTAESVGLANRNAGRHRNPECGETADAPFAPLARHRSKIGVVEMIVLELDRKIDIGRDRTRDGAH